MQINRGDVVKADGGEWRVERIGPGDSVQLISLDGSRQCWPSKAEIEINLSFNQRLNEGDMDALAQLTDEQRRTFEANTWRFFFARHVGIADCEATRSMLVDYLNGDFISLAALEQGLEKLREKLPTKQL